MIPKHTVSSTLSRRVIVLQLNLDNPVLLDNPCLSFDIIRDKLGDNREATPLTCYLVGGTQVEKTTQNQLIVMRLSNMHNITDEKQDDDSDKEEEDSDEEDEEAKKKEKEPVLQAVLIRHNGEVNRIKVTSCLMFEFLSLSEQNDWTDWGLCCLEFLG